MTQTPREVIERYLRQSGVSFSQMTTEAILSALAAAGIGTFDTRTHAAVPRVDAASRDEIEEACQSLGWSHASAAFYEGACWAQSRPQRMQFLSERGLPVSALYPPAAEAEAKGGE